MPRPPLTGADLPQLATALPGPRSVALSAELARVEAPGINTLGADDRPALVWEEALGANVLDVDGNRFVDLTAGFGVAALGHRPAAVVAAVARQAATLVHGLGDVAAHPARVALAAKLAALVPVDRARIHFAISGADAVEIALKTAIAAGRPSRRSRIVAFDPGYHGMTLGALGVSSRPAFRAPFVEHLDPHVVRLPYGAPVDDCRAALTGAAAVVVEPLVGREGVVVPPPGWLAALAAATRAAGALLVADEIFTGFGRTGTLFAVDHEGVRPDLLCCGKALGGGLPIAAVAGRAELMESWKSGGEALHTATFVAHPLACAAALALLDESESVDLPACARRIGAQVEQALSGRLPAGVLRGRGALWGLAFGSPSRAGGFVAALRDRGFLLLAGGAHGDVVQIVPPLTIAPALLDAALAAIVEVLSGPAASG
ncbi:MAG: aminotransferase class III-fold pyridoxal phosphate-dependent enzyme [Thermoanaerobaculia bacterium]